MAKFGNMRNQEGYFDPTTRARTSATWTKTKRAMPVAAPLPPGGGAVLARRETVMAYKEPGLYYCCPQDYKCLRGERCVLKHLCHIPRPAKKEGAANG